MFPLSIVPDPKAAVPSAVGGWITATVHNSQHDEGLWQEIENNPTPRRGSGEAVVRRITQGALVCWLVASLPFFALAGQVATNSPTKKDEVGVLVHAVESEYQSRPTKIKVLPPDCLVKGRRYRDGPKREHSWHSGWLPEAVQMLVQEPKRFQRAEVYFSGDVQGVGFRQTTSTLARQFTITGFVKNLPDGRVQLLVEGQPKEIELFLAAIEKAMEKNISKTEEKTSPATGEFRGFGIRW